MQVRRRVRARRLERRRERLEGGPVVDRSRFVPEVVRHLFLIELCRTACKSLKCIAAFCTEPWLRGVELSVKDFESAYSMRIACV